MSENISCDTDDVSDYGNEIPPEIVEAANEVSLNSLPSKSNRLFRFILCMHFYLKQKLYSRISSSFAALSL